MADLPLSGLPSVVTPLPADIILSTNDGVSRGQTRQQLHELQPGEILLLPNGADASNPEVQFPNSGIYEDALDQLSIAHAGAQVAHGTTAAAGGLFVNNTLTGGGLERVLTTSDAANFGEYRGVFDASGGTFPVTLNQGDWFNCTVAGTVDGQPFVIGDILVALVDSPSTVTFAANWSIVPHIGVADHLLLTNIGVNTHAQIDTHIADGTIHFTEASIDHTNITNIGTNTHAQIDTHIADSTIHFAVTTIQDLYSSGDPHVRATDFGGALIDFSGNDVDPTDPGGTFETALDFMTEDGLSFLGSIYYDASNTVIFENLTYEGRMEFWTTDDAGGGTAMLTLNPFGVSAGIEFFLHGGGRIANFRDNGAGGAGHLELTGGTSGDEAGIRLVDNILGPTDRAFFGFDNSDDLIVRNSTAGGDFQVLLNNNELAINAIVNAGVTTYFNGTAVSATVLATAGGLQVNNLSTGAGFERVLTTADLGSPVGHTHVAADITDFASAVSSNAAVAANTAKVTNATHTGDVTGSAGLTIALDVVTNAKLTNMAGNTIKGRNVGTSGDPVDIAIGTNTVLGRVAGNIVAAQIVAGQIASNAVTTAKILDANVGNAKLANMVQATVKGRAAGAGTGAPVDLSATQLTAIPNLFTSGLQGMVPASGGGTTNFLRADGTFAAPSATLTPPIDLDDSEQIRFGTGNDYTIEFDGTFSVHDLPAASTLRFQGGAFVDFRDGINTRWFDLANSASVQMSMSSATELFVEGSGSQFMVMDGVNQRFRDGNELLFGTGDDFSIETPDGINLNYTGVSGANINYTFAGASIFDIDMAVLRISGADELQHVQGTANSTVDWEWNGATSFETVFGSNVASWSIQGLTATDSIIVQDGPSIQLNDPTDSVNHTFQRLADRLAITGTGSDFVQWESSAGPLRFLDSVELQFGTGNDFQVSSDGTDLVINGTTDVQFTGGHRVQVFQSASANFIGLSVIAGIGRISGTLTDMRMQLNGVDEFFIQDSNASGQTSGAQVKDHGAILHDVGFNDLQVFNDNVSDTLEAQHAGQVAFKDATTARTLTLAASGDLDFPVGFMTTVINAFTSGDYTITEGASTTLFYLDGATRIDTAGGCTVGPGGVANIWRESATVYYIWGTGITP